MPDWDGRLYLHCIPERAPELAAELVEGLMERTHAQRGVLLMRGEDGAPRVLALRESGAGALDPAGYEPPPQALDALAGADRSVLSLRGGKAMAVPLRAVVREPSVQGPQRRRFEAPASFSTLGCVWLEGDEVDAREAAPEIQVASTLGSLLLAGSLSSSSEEVGGPFLLEPILETEIELAMQASTPVTLLLAEIDAGRERAAELGPWELSQRLERGLRDARQVLRRSDLVLRCGARGAAAVLPATDGEGAEVTAKKIRRALDAVLEVPVRIGSAVFPDDGDSPAELLATAASEVAPREELEPETHIVASHPRDLAGLYGLQEALGRLEDLPRAAALAAGARSACWVSEKGGELCTIHGVGPAPKEAAGLVRRAREQGGRADGAEPRRVAWWVAASPMGAGGLVLEAAEGEKFTWGGLERVRLLLALAARLTPGPRARDEQLETAGYAGLVGESAAMRDVYRKMAKVLESKVTVLLVGETGTGKELVARAIHERSDRSSGPFVTVDCGSLPPSLADAELFGHAKGAFTDASSEREGLIERADGGTLLLDEITSMPIELQPRLLRFLQEGEIRRVGETDYRAVDVRVLAASNHDPRQEVEEGKLRLDLYHRLEGMQIHIPPLRRRKEDIPALVQWFLRSFSREEGGPPPSLTGDALESLLAHDWPGNVRELENAVRAGALVSDDEVIDVDDLPEHLRGRQDGPLADRVPRTNDEFKAAKEAATADITRRFLRAALAESAGNVSEAARRAGLQRTYFHRLMSQYEVTADDYRDAD